MSVDVMQERQQAHAYLHRLPPALLSAVRSLFETILLDPASRANPPVEDEEISEDEECAVAEAREWRKHNQPIPHEEVLAELGRRLRSCGRATFRATASATA